TCRKQWLPFDIKVIPAWLTKGDGLCHPGKSWVVNVSSFRNRNATDGTADVCHPEQSIDRDFHRSHASSMLANMSHCAERERAKAVVTRFELLFELTTSKPFRFGKLAKPTSHHGMAFVYAKATLNDRRNTPRRR